MSAPECEIWFYHLERSGPREVLPPLLEKSLARGWRALVRSNARERLEDVDLFLWSFREDAFLAHGLAREPHADRQPVLLTTDAENLNAAEVLILLDSAEIGDLAGLRRCILIFDGHDEAALARAREQWRAFKTAGRTTSYWRQKESGGWEQAG